jgi:hypothetical protein
MPPPNGAASDGFLAMPLPPFSNGVNGFPLNIGQIISYF